MIDVAGYEDLYAVTRCGKVWSKRRKKYLSPGSSSRGQYKSVCLFYKGVVKGMSIHRLVAIAYIPNPDGKPEVNHIDGNKLNNHASNLEWVTGSENMIHAIKTGLLDLENGKKSRFQPGFDPRRNAPRRLTNDQVVSMRSRSDLGETYRDIAKDFNVDESSIRRCCKRESYKDII